MANTAYLEDNVTRALIQALGGEFIQVDRNGVVLATESSSQEAGLVIDDAVDSYLWDIFPQEFAQKLMKAMTSAFSFGDIQVITDSVVFNESLKLVEARVLRCGEWDAIILLKEAEKDHQAVESDSQLRTKLQAVDQKMKTISGLIPMCSCCKKIRDEEGFWKQLEVYIQQHTNAQVTHTMCPTCEADWYK